MRAAECTYRCFSLDGHRSFLMLPLLFCLMFVTCSLDDMRDECCDTNQIRFRYLYRGMDRFTDYIFDVHYYLFNSAGAYLGEMSPLEDNMARVDISKLTAGSYTIVAVGNLYDYGTLQGYADKGLEAFRFSVDDYYSTSPAAFRSGDRIYRGECDFTVEQGEANSFLGEMSNEHCVLRVKVEWKLVPSFSSGYRFDLDGVGTAMEMNENNAYSIDVHRFPPVESYEGRMIEEVPLRRFALTASMVTLRWTDNDMPTFRLYHNDTPVTKPIDLRTIFRQWGWYPSRTAVQEYEIRMMIRPDGSIEINQGFDVGVNDWIDGGTFG